MNRVVAWVVAAVLAALAAGFALGLATCRAVEPSEPIELLAADAEVVNRFAADFGLRREQVTLLRAILRNLRDSKEDVLRRYAQKLPEDVREKLADAHEVADKRIKFMLDADQRRRYEQQRKTENPGR